MKKKIVFGTDGIRGKADEYPFTQEALYHIGSAIGCWATKKYKRFYPRILIAADPRDSGTRIKQELITGLLTQPLNIIDGFVLPTPAVAQLVCQDKSFDLGIVISASHNLYKDNGIKFFDSSTCKLLPEDEKALLDSINTYVPVDKKFLGKQSFWKEAKLCYEDNFNQFFKKDFLSGISIAIDCSNGATSGIAKPILERFGANVTAIADTPDGKNINEGCGTLHPEFLRDFMAQNDDIDIGFSFDGDGDRIVCVNKDGSVKDGDDMLCLLSQHSKYKQCDEIVGTVMSNSGFEDLLAEQGTKFTRTAVGDKHIVAVLKQKQLPIGGEVSGHLIARDYLGTGDSIFITLRVLESIIQNHNWNITTFDKKPQVLLNVSISQRDDLQKECYQSIIKSYNKKLKKGRSLIRFSGTEDVLRVMIEDIEQENAQKIAQDLAAALVCALSDQAEINRSL